MSDLNTEKEKYIIELLSPYASEMDDERLAIFLTLSVGRVLKKTTSLEEIILPQNALRHITDWLQSAIINDESWLNNIDDQNRPKKLMKFSTIEQIVQEADKAMLIAANKSNNIKLIEGDEELYAHLLDGYYIVKLRTPAALDRESSQMQHCIGQGSYDRKVYKRNYQYLSLRDSYGKSHITLEIVNNEIQQIQGKQNKSPIQKYMDILIPYLMEQKLGVNHDEIKERNLGYYVNGKKEWYDILNLPEDLKVKKDLNLNFTNIENLPKNLHVGQSLFLMNTPIKKLPTGLKVLKDLYISNSDIIEIPKGTVIGRNLYLNNINISLNDIDVKGCVSLEDSQLKSLPDNLKLNYSLKLSFNPIKKLPKGLEVIDLDLVQTKITNLPSDLIVNGSLLLYDSKIINLPENFKVGIDLDISSTSIKKIPKGLTVGGDLNVEETNIKEIGENLSVGGDFIIDYQCKLTIFPKNAFIGGYLDLSRSRIETLSEYLTVGADLDLRYTEIKALPKGLNVGYSLNLKSTSITELSDDLVVGESISFDEGQITHLPDTIPNDIIIVEGYEEMTAAAFRDLIAIRNRKLM